MMFFSCEILYEPATIGYPSQVPAEKLGEYGEVGILTAAL